MANSTSHSKTSLTPLQIGLILALITLVVFLIFLIVLTFVLSQPKESEHKNFPKANLLTKNETNMGGLTKEEDRKYKTYCALHCQKQFKKRRAKRSALLKDAGHGVEEKFTRRVKSNISSFLTTADILLATYPRTLDRAERHMMNSTKKERKTIKCQSKDMPNSITFSHVAALLEEIYVDEENELRFLCSVAILTYKWVLASGKCVQPISEDYDNVKGLYVRAASNIWSKGGSFHPVQKILFPEYAISFYSTVVAIQLQFPMPRLDFIVPSKIPIKTKFQPMQIATSYDWPETDMAPLRQRKKFGALEAKYIAMYRDKDCLLGVYKSTQNIFCGYEFKTGTKCYHKLGSPLFSDGLLIGIGMDQTCFSGNNATIYYYEDITRHRKWLKKIITTSRRNI